LPLSRRSRGRIAKLPAPSDLSAKNHGSRFEGILKIEFAGKQLPKAQKPANFDYSSAPGHSAHSMASEFFTDDE
jgi:hypothetical protein